MPKIRPATDRDVRHALELGHEAQAAAVELIKRLTVAPSPIIDGPLHSASSALAIAHAFTELAAMIMMPAVLAEQQREVDAAYGTRAAPAPPIDHGTRAAPPRDGG